MQFTTTPGGRNPVFVVDEGSIIRSNGKQIDWANVNVSYEDANGVKRIPAGTVMGELLGSGKISPRVVTTNPATCILLTDANEESDTDSLTGYGIARGGSFYEALLPDASGSPRVLASAVKTELGSRFVFEKFIDTR